MVEVKAERPYSRRKTAFPPFQHPISDDFLAHAFAYQEKGCPVPRSDIPTSVEGKGGNHLISAGQVLETNYLTPLALHFLRVGDQVIGGSDSVSTCPVYTRTSLRIKRRGLLDAISYGEILDTADLISIG
ncbi:hypothetical protein TNCT_693261 [Trichonephila clavata]|uniref:Uncharacterized protein n=1 Tax=Trichonephila clavata TaxID=2740835 RepID=A0A8X6FZN8_TRICU|nr:hypothetical protein TNCT_693261 [Trichonephila clavata]